jgi:hypothetical protein
MRTRMRKGFFRILEVVIVAMLVFVTLTQLYSVPKANQPWDVTKLSVMSQDLIYSLDVKGVDWFDKAEVNRTLYDILPKTMGYAVSVRQDVRPAMRIGCVCSAADYADVGAILADFTLNGIPRDFILTRIAPGTLDFSEASSDYDAILLCESQSFTDAQVSDAEAYLAEGGGIVELSDLTQPQVDGSRWYGDVMNIQWVSDSVNVPSSRAFFPYMDPNERRYPVQKIFDAVPPALPSFENFDNFGSETIYPKDNAAEKIVVIQDSYYQGGSLDGNEVPLSVLDWGVNGSGRVAWMSNTSISGSTDDEESAKKILKALVIWAASGKEYTIVGGTVSTGATASMRKVYGGSGAGMYEPVRIYLTIGYHF